MNHGHFAPTLLKVKPGDIARVRAVGLTLEGEGVAQLEQRELFCAGLFPGEQAEVRIEAVSKQHPRAFAKLLALETPHPQRRLSPCPNHVGRGGRCTGCALMDLEEGAQRALKRDMLRDRFGLEVREVEAGPDELGYRFSSKRTAFAQNGRVQLGSFVRNSHQHARMDGCLVDHPQIVRAFAEVEAAANALDLEPYDERSRKGDLRHVWAKTNGRQVIVTLITAHEESRAQKQLPARIQAIDGVAWSVQSGSGNNLRGSAPVVLRGLRELSTELLGQEVEVGALGFLQPNPEVAARAYAALTELATEPSANGLAFDLYAGAGITTRRLREQFAEVLPCEAYPESAEGLGVAPQTVEDFLTAELARSPQRRPDLVIANPPRKGMGPAVCVALRQLAAPRLHIMSCGPEGLARDLRALTEEGSGYRLLDLRAFDTLPQTPHVELVAKLALV